MDATHAVAESPAAEPPVAAEPRLPGALALLRASLGFVALGAMASLDRPVTSGWDDGPLTLVTHLGALALTAPSLLVAHPVLGLRAQPEALVTALASAYVRTGHLALGLVPFGLFFALTTSIGPQVVAVTSLVAGALGLTAAAGGLVAAERRADPVLPSWGRMHVLTAGWVLLTLAGAVRIAFEVSA